MKTPRAIVIDNNPAEQNRLCALIREFEVEVEMAACYSNAKIALTELDHVKPDFIFIDCECCTKPFLKLMEMRDRLKTEVIIIVEWKEELIYKASNIYALVVKKPYLDHQMHKVLRVATESFIRRSSVKHTDAGITKPIKEPTLIIEEGKKKRMIKVKDVVYCQSSNNALLFYLDHQVQWSRKVAEGTGHVIVSSRSFGEWEDELESKGIYRCHRSYGFNINYASSMDAGDDPLLNLGGDNNVPVSKTYLETVERLVKED